jgi:hypothetical protein
MPAQGEHPQREAQDRLIGKAEFSGMACGGGPQSTAKG